LELLSDASYLTYKYDGSVARDLHIEQMKRKGWRILTNGHKGIFNEYGRRITYVRNKTY